MRMPLWTNPMKVEAPDNQGSIIPPMPEAFLPAAKETSVTKQLARRAFSSGPDVSALPSSRRVVAYAVRVRADLKVGERDFSGEICLHEAVILRRFYEDSGGGSVRITADWAPALERLIPLTHEQLKAELQRMTDNFIVIRENGTTCVVDAFLGAEPGVKLRRLHEIMGKQLARWSEIVEIARKRVQGPSPDPDLALIEAFEAITPRELEEVANLADPSRDGVGEIELPEAMSPTASVSVPTAQAKPENPEEVESRINSEVQTPDAMQTLVNRLVQKSDINQQQALAVATLAELFDGAEIPEKDLQDALGSVSNAKLEAVRRALKG